jgi:hypothetical protein
MLAVLFFAVASLRPSVLTLTGYFYRRARTARIKKNYFSRRVELPVAAV